MKVLGYMILLGLLAANCQQDGGRNEKSTNKVVAEEELEYEIVDNYQIKGDCQSDQIEGNKGVYEALENNGDINELPRDVHHYIHFKTEKDREDFMVSYVDSSYEEVYLSYYEDEYPYTLHLVDSSAIDHEAMDLLCVEFCELAKQHNGEYDGWECSIRVSEND